MKKPSLTTLHRIARVILGILMVLVALNVGRMGMLFIIFSPLIGGISSFTPGFLLIGVLLSVMLTTTAAPLLIYKGTDSPNSRLETGLVLVNVIAGFVYLAAFPTGMGFDYDAEASTIGSVLYIVSTVAIVWFLPKGFVKKLKAQPRTVAADVFRPSLGKITLVLSLFVIGFLMLFMMGPLFLILGSLLGISFSRGDGDSSMFFAQMIIYAVIVAICAVIGLSIVMMLRKIRRPTSVNSDSHLVE